MKFKTFLSLTVVASMLATSVVFAEDAHHDQDMNEDMHEDMNEDMSEDMHEDMNHNTDGTDDNTEAVEAHDNLNHYGVVTAIDENSITVEHSTEASSHPMTFDLTGTTYYDNATGASTSKTDIAVGETVNVYGSDGVATAVVTDVDPADATCATFIVLEATDTPNEFTNAIDDPATNDVIYVMPEGTVVEEGDLVLEYHTIMTMSIPAYATVEYVQVIEQTETVEVEDSIPSDTPQVTNPIVTNYNTDTTIYVEGTEVAYTQPLAMANTELLVPVRTTVEALGGEIVWSPEHTDVILNGTTYRFVDDSANVAIVTENGVTENAWTMAAPASVIDDTFYIPFTFVIEHLSSTAEFTYDAETNSAYLYIYELAE